MTPPFEGGERGWYTEPGDDSLETRPELDASAIERPMRQLDELLREYGRRQGELPPGTAERVLEAWRAKVEAEPPPPDLLLWTVRGLRGGGALLLGTALVVAAFGPAEPALALGAGAVACYAVAAYLRRRF